MTLDPPVLAGRYRLIVTAALLDFIERAFVSAAPPAERQKVRAEALAEATTAELHLLADGTLVSRAGEQELYRTQVPLSPNTRELSFQKPAGEQVTLKLLGDGTLIAIQAGKPEATFVRME